MMLDNLHGRGRPRTALSPAEHADLDSRFAVVILPERGFSVIFENSTGQAMTVSAFRRLLGAKATLWLESPQRQMFFSVAHYRLLHPASQSRTAEICDVPA
jgi:hypothetical protein